MQSQRKGSNLKAEIRMALSYLGRDTSVDLSRTSIEQLLELKSRLHAEVRTKQAATAVDPRDPDYSRKGIFIHHNCWRCKDGSQPCVRGNSSQCEYPHARND